MNDKNSHKKTVLVVSKEADDIRSICESLGDEVHSYITANSGSEALSNITYQLPHIIISDVNLPDMHGYELCKKIRTGIKTKLIPFIFISSSNKVDDRVSALQTGADAYLAKPYNVEELKALVLTKIRLFDEFYHLSVTDELTRLFNRREFFKQCGQEMDNPANQVISLAIIDLDHFKNINDTYGHQTGDLVLMTLAGLLKNNSSDTFFPARFGGEEFVILFPGISSPEAKKIIDDIRNQLLGTPFSPPGSQEQFTVSFSAGIAEYPSMASNISELLSRSDQALYTVKNEGRGKSYIFGPIMARNDRFWEFLKRKKGDFIEHPFHDPVTKLPFLPYVLEQIINLDFEVRSIGIFIVRAIPLFKIEDFRGDRNLQMDIENLKNIILWACEHHFPSDTYIALSGFFDYEFVLLFPSIVDFSYNEERFNGLCRDIYMDIFLYTFNYLFDISFSSDVIYYSRKNPRKLLKDITEVQKNSYMLDTKKDFFANIVGDVHHTIESGSALSDVLVLKNTYNLISLEPVYHFFSSVNFIIKSEFADILMLKNTSRISDLDRFLAIFRDNFSDQMSCPLLFPCVHTLDMEDQISSIHNHFKDKEIIFLINEFTAEKIKADHLLGLHDILPANISLGIDNCFIGNDLLNTLSIVDFRLLVFSEHITRNLHLFPERIKVINGLKQFTDELGIPVLVRNVLIEEEYQILKDLKIPCASGPYITNMV